MATVFNAPVLPVVSQDLFGGCQLRSFAGDTICDDSRIFSVLPVCYSFNFESLGDMRKIEVFIDFGGYPDFSGLFSSMVGLILVHHTI